MEGKGEEGSGNRVCLRAWGRLCRVQTGEEKSKKKREGEEGKRGKDRSDSEKGE